MVHGWHVSFSSLSVVPPPPLCTCLFRQRTLENTSSPFFHSSVKKVEIRETLIEECHFGSSATLDKVLLSLNTFASLQSTKSCLLYNNNNNINNNNSSLFLRPPSFPPLGTLPCRTPLSRQALVLEAVWFCLYSCLRGEPSLSGWALVLVWAGPTQRQTLFSERPVLEESMLRPRHQSAQQPHPSSPLPSPSLHFTSLHFTSIRVQFAPRIRGV